MASAPSEPTPVLGRVDKKGRLVSADPQLEELQRQAGSSLGKALALPQIAAIASLARKLGIPVVAVVDTNCDPQEVDFPIPGNDDAARAIQLYCNLIADAVLDGLSESTMAAGHDPGASANPREPALR